MPKDTFFNLPEDKRNRVIEMAIEEFSNHPYPQASLGRICAAAGISKGSIYQYFDNKLDLYRWLMFDETGRRKLAYIEAHALDDPEATLFEQLEQMTLSGLRFALDNPRLSRMAIALFERSADPEVAKLHDEAQHRGHEYFRELLSTAQQRGSIRADVDTDIAAYFVATLLGHGLLNALLDKLQLDLHEFLSHPQLGQRVTEADLKNIIHNAIELLRRGLGNEGRAP